MNTKRISQEQVFYNKNTRIKIDYYAEDPKPLKVKTLQGFIKNRLQRGGGWEDDDSHYGDYG